MSKVTQADVESLVELFDGSDWKELHLEIEGFEIHLSKDPSRRLGTAAGVEAGPARAAGSFGAGGATGGGLTGGGSAAVGAGAASALRFGHAPSAGGGSASAGGSAPVGGSTPVGVEPSWVAVRAPNLGTFYRAPKPGAAPFVEIGQTVSADTELCLIEVMKLFTALRAGVAGVLKQVCASDAELIEHDQVLFYIEPAR